MKKKNSPFVTLVGAGPGDPELISIAGVRALKECNVVLYDALVHPAVLDWAIGAKKIFVGKRKGYKRFTQNQINDLLVLNAFEHGNVVRLKGGDSFIFGRGSEEVAWVESYGISTRVIPGISSSTSAPVTQGIPLTLRGVSRGFWVLTATVEEDQLASDLELAARSSATVVILMGMSKLDKIAKIYNQLNKADTPVSIVQNAYMPDQRSVISTMGSIVSVVKKEGISNPAVITIGEVVNHHRSNTDAIEFHSLIKKVS